MKSDTPVVLSEKFWEHYFSAYDELNKLIPYQELITRVIEEINPKKGDRILDAGAGTGNFAIPLAELGGNVLAVDTNQIALRMLNVKSPKIGTFRCSIQELLLQNQVIELESFNAVVCINVLYTIPHHERGVVLQNLYKLLRHGGRIVIVNPSRNFSILQYCRYTIRQQFSKGGFLSICGLITRYLPNFLKIIYYNIIINYHFKSNSFFSDDEQTKLIFDAGFTKILKREKVYAFQSEMIVAEKL